ncbi:MAG: class I SAM-dependent methyltransferase [Anaerolineales bacterium]|nr:class I SAM-dependent methyltransferase [Anaerolineales bacterium]
MPTEKEVYQAHADQYERLIRREDYQGNLLAAIQEYFPLNKHVDVVELGAGTGRLTRLLAPRVRSIKAFDTSAHMLEVAEKSLREMGLSNWETGVADHRQVPVANQSADLVISGWSFCYLAVWGGSNWQFDLQAGLDEIQRILRPDGMVILIESLGTGTEKPKPPEHLWAYFDWLTETGFERGWMRTDYRFESLDEAVELSTFFFGEEMGQKVRENNWQIPFRAPVLPECTGIWWKRVKSGHV